MMNLIINFMRLFILVFIGLFITNVPLVNSSNWAQVSGPLKQNVVLTVHPSPDHKNYHSHWGPRYGMAVT